MFWDLTKTQDFKSGIYKIISESSIYLQPPQIEFIFKEITLTPPQKLDMQDFNVLSELGKYSKSSNAELQVQVAEFFWKMIADSDQYNDELLQSCILKFAEMVKYWTLEQKKPYFDRLPGALQNTKNSVIPMLQLFKKIISDQKDRVVTSSYKPSTGAVATTQYAKHTTATGAVVWSSSNRPAATTGGESIYNLTTTNNGTT